MWSFTTWQSQHTLSNTLPEASPPDSHNTLSPTPYSHNTLSPTPYLKRHHLTVTTHSVQHLTWSFTTRQSQHTQSNTLPEATWESQHPQFNILQEASLTVTTASVKNLTSNSFIIWQTEGYLPTGSLLIPNKDTAFRQAPHDQSQHSKCHYVTCSTSSPSYLTCSTSSPAESYIVLHVVK